LVLNIFVNSLFAINLRLRKVILISSMLLISAILILNTIRIAACQENLPSDSQISEAGINYFNYLKDRGYPIASYETIKVHKAGGWYGGGSDIVNYVIFIAYWQQDSYYSDGPYAILVQSSLGEWAFREPFPGEYHLLEGYSLGWVTTDGATTDEDSEERPEDGSVGGEDLVGGEDRFPLELIIGLVVLIAVIAGLGFFGKNLAKGKKADTPRKTRTYALPPAQTAQVFEQLPYSLIDPVVKKWIEENPIYPGYWFVTSDGKFVTNEINPEYTIPVEWIKGTSDYQLAEIFSTPVPSAKHEMNADAMQWLAKNVAPELLEKFTLGSWSKLKEDQKKEAFKKFEDLLAFSFEIPPLDIEFDPNLEYEAAYDRNAKPPKIQVKPSGRTWDSPMMAIRAITHEFQHHIQHVAPEKLIGGTPAYRNAVQKNVENYISYEDDPVRYAGQLIERDAESIAKNMANAISKAAYERKLERLVETIWGKTGLKILKKPSKIRRGR